MNVTKKPTAFSNRVRRLLIEHIKNHYDDFDESRLVYCFVSRYSVHQGHNDVCAIMYFKYILDVDNPTQRYNIYDIGFAHPQNHYTGDLVLTNDGGQATYYVYKEEEI